jgi:hypothetical protein
MMVTSKDWLVRCLEPAQRHSGVKAFQMLPWGGVDGWNRDRDALYWLPDVEKL